MSRESEVMTSKGGWVQAGLVAGLVVVCGVAGCSGGDPNASAQPRPPVARLSVGLLDLSDGGCSCMGGGADGGDTVSCGNSTCGEDGNTYLCNSPGGEDWSFQSAGCCLCTGGGANGNVTVSCGGTTCGEDGNTYLCNSPGGEDWSYQFAGCGTPPPTDAGCSCTGGGANGNVTVNCGDTTCGEDGNTYLCNSPGGEDWSYQFAGCGTPPPADAGCSCTGGGANGNVTVNCGDTTCGEDGNTYVCNSPGGTNWSLQSGGCSAPADAGCSCTGGGANGNVTVNCGDMTCGVDGNTYLCNSPGGTNWSFQSGGCSAPADAGQSCTCPNGGPNGDLTVNCGDTTCGEDGNTYLCSSPGGVSGYSFDRSGC